MSKKILYIEDDLTAQALVTRIIRGMGLEIHTAHTSEEGYAKALADPPDLILMDLMLPGLDGFETTTKIRHTDALKHIPIVAVSALSSEEERQLAGISGCNGYIVKPFDQDYFENYIRNALETGVIEPPSFDAATANVELRKYTQRLVQRLTDKIQQLYEINHRLQATNQQLDQLLEEVKSNNADLLQLNMLANQILAYPGREALYNDLPKLISERLHLTSAGLYLVNQETISLDLRAHHRVLAPTDCGRIYIHRNPFFDLVYYQEPLLVDAIWIQAAERVDSELGAHIRSILKAYGTDTLYFLPIQGRPKGEAEWDCDNNDCPAFINKDSHYWTKQLSQLDPKDMMFESRLRDISSYYFRCCHYSLRGILALGISNQRLNENTRPMLQSFVRTVGLTLETIQLYEDLKEAYLLAEKQAITDGLTELYNYRSFGRQLDREIKRSKRHWSKTSLIMIDIDFFKHYNDTHGHPAGDKILRKLADLLRSNIRSSDVVARYGGEEFVFILPETPKAAAVKLAEKIRKVVQDEHFPHEDTQPNGDLTISLGVATFPDDAQSAEELIQKADEQLYQAKGAGRNQVCYKE